MHLDFDPEEIAESPPSDSDALSDEESSDEDEEGREHYIDVGYGSLPPHEDRSDI